MGGCTAAVVGALTGFDYVARFVVNIRFTDLILLLNLIPNKVVKLIMKLFVYNHVPVSDNISGKPVGFPNGPQLLWSIIILIDKKRAFTGGDYIWWLSS